MYHALKQLVLGDYLDSVGQVVHREKLSHHSEWISGVVGTAAAVTGNIHGEGVLIFKHISSNMRYQIRESTL